MPAVATANVWPIASTISTADAASTDSMLSAVRKTSEISPKTMSRTMNAGMTVHSAQKPGSRRRPRSSSIARGSSVAGSGAAGAAPFWMVVSLISATDQRRERVVVGVDRLGEVLRGLGDVVLGDDLDGRLDVGRQLLALRGGEAGLNAELADRVRVLRDRGGHVAGLDRLQRVFDAVDADDRHVALLAGVLDRLGDAERHLVVGREEALDVRVGAHQVLGGAQRLRAVPVAGDRLERLEAALGALGEPLHAGVAGRVARDAADDADLPALDEVGHGVGRHPAGGDVVGADVRRDVKARLLGRVRA